MSFRICLPTASLPLPSTLCCCQVIVRYRRLASNQSFIQFLTENTQGYSEFRLPKHHPSLTPLIITYAQGSDPATSLGPHWQQPGRGILVNHFLDVPAATEVAPEAYAHWERVYFAGETSSFLLLT